MDNDDPHYLAIPMDKWESAQRDGQFTGPIETTNSMRLAEQTAAGYAKEHSSHRAVVVKLSADSLQRGFGVSHKVHDRRHRDHEFSFEFLADKIVDFFAYVIGFYDCGPDLPDDPDDGNY